MSLTGTERGRNTGNRVTLPATLSIETHGDWKEGVVIKKLLIL